MSAAVNLSAATASNKKNTTVLRLLTFPTYIGWLVYDIAILSYAGILNQIFVTISLSIAIIRLDLIPYLKSRKRITTTAENN